jgi:hypothetical protein
MIDPTQPGVGGGNAALPANKELGQEATDEGTDDAEIDKRPLHKRGRTNCAARELSS